MTRKNSAALRLLLRLLLCKAPCLLVELKLCLLYRLLPKRLAFPLGHHPAVRAKLLHLTEGAFKRRLLRAFERNPLEDKRGYTVCMLLTMHEALRHHGA